MTLTFEGRRTVVRVERDLEDPDTGGRYAPSREDERYYGVARPPNGVLDILDSAPPPGADEEAAAEEHEAFQGAQPNPESEDPRAQPRPR